MNIGTVGLVVCESGDSALDTGQFVYPV